MSTRQAHIDEMMNATLTRVGKGAMMIAHVLQDIQRPGDRLAALVYCMKCVVDKHKLDLPRLLEAADKYEKEAKKHYVPELSGARAYIEGEVVF